LDLHKEGLVSLATVYGGPAGPPYTFLKKLDIA